MVLDQVNASSDPKALEQAARHWRAVVVQVESFLTDELEDWLVLMDRAEFEVAP